MVKPVLSIGMIFKNEIRCLERCMRSLAPLREAVPCELVMADTGSTDGSREVAEKYADILIDFPWVNDFSAARNAVLDHCSGEWYMTMDSDEWLNSDFSGLTAFLSSPPSGNGFAVVIRNYHTTQNQEDFSDYWLPRLIRRQNDLRYMGAIHETPCYQENGKAYSPGPYQRLSGVMIYHDGYAADDPESRRAKSERNMALLRKRLEREPHNLQCLMQCVQSSGDWMEGMQYARRMLETARVSTDPRDKPLLPALYHTAIQTAYGASADQETYQWLTEAEEKFPISMLIRIDGNGYAALMAYKREDVARCLDYGTKWRTALTAWDRGEGNNYVEHAFGHLYLANQYMRLALGCRVLDAACNLRNWSEAQKWVDFLSALPLNEEFSGKLAGLLLKNSGHLEVSDCLSTLWEKCIERYQSQDNRLHSSGEAGSSALLQELGKCQKDDLAAWQAIAGMGDCDPGRSARIFLAKTVEEAHGELEQIKEWKHVLYPATARLTELGIRLPDGFSRQPSEALAAFASALAENRWNMTELALKCTETEELQTLSLPRLLWLDDLAAAAMLQADWADAAKGEALTALFARLEGALGDRLYRFEEITEENISVLPAIHRFGWCLLAGQTRLKQGDLAGYIHALRTGVNAAPDMKGAATFLSGRIEAAQCHTEASQELLALAGQVRALLAQFPPDSPAVIELKASAAYQKVAYLIGE